MLGVGKTRRKPSSPGPFSLMEKGRKSLALRERDLRLVRY